MIPVPLVDLAFRKVTDFRKLLDSFLGPFYVLAEFKNEMFDLVLTLPNPVLLLYFPPLALPCFWFGSLALFNLHKDICLCHCEVFDDGGILVSESFFGVFDRPLYLHAHFIKFKLLLTLRILNSQNRKFHCWL